jgi:RimJ/RimL family protein N-acetyltransferase
MTSVPAPAAIAIPDTPSAASGSGPTIGDLDGRPQVRRIRPTDAARMRALRLEMLADAPLAFLETVAEAAARPHAEFAARVRQNSVGSEIAQFIAELPSSLETGRPRATGRPPEIGESVGHLDGHLGSDPARRFDGRLVGHLGGHAVPTEPGLTVIFAVYLTPAWRGSGLLADLIDQVAAWSLAAGRPQLMLEVVVGNDRALRAYQRLGFVDTGIRLPHPRVPAFTELQMRRRA